MTTARRSALPDVADVLQVEASVRQPAPSEWEDFNGHVTVSRYYDFHMSSAEVALERLGWTEHYLARTRHSLFSVEQHLCFYDEVLVGQEVSTHLRLLDRSDRMLHAVSILVNHDTGSIANTVELVEGHVNPGQ